MRDELSRDECRSRRVAAQVANDALALFDSRIRVLHAQHRPCTRLVKWILKREPNLSLPRRSGIAKAGTAALESADRPSSENLCELQHVLLRVAAVDAERMELQQLARVVFIQPPPATASCSSRARTDGLEIVEVDEHRRMLRRRQHHILEPTEDMRTDDVALVAARQRRDEDLCGR